MSEHSMDGASPVPWLDQLIHHDCAKEIDRLRAHIAELEEKADKLNMIVLAVERKFHNEERWETALRYVREREIVETLSVRTGSERAVRRQRLGR